MPFADILLELDKLLAETNPVGLHVRTMEPDELLPDNIPHGLPAGILLPQPEWCWLVFNGVTPIALLIAGPVQNLVYLMRICAATAASPSCLVYLLRHSFSDMVSRGYNGYIVHLEDDSFGKQMLRIARRAGKIVEVPSILVLGSTQIDKW